MQFQRNTYYTAIKSIVQFTMTRQSHINTYIIRFHIQCEHEVLGMNLNPPLEILIPYSAAAYRKLNDFNFFKNVTSVQYDPYLLLKKYDRTNLHYTRLYTEYATKQFFLFLFLFCISRQARRNATNTHVVTDSGSESKQE